MIIASRISLLSLIISLLNGTLLLLIQFFAALVITLLRAQTVINIRIGLRWVLLQNILKLFG
jgi:hypothetical protein